MKSKFVAALSTSLLVIPLTFSCNKNQTACNIIKKNYKEFVGENTKLGDYETKTVEEIKNELETKTIGGVDTYYFKDIDYKTDWIRSKWDAAGHLSRTLKIAIAADKKNSNDLKDIAKKLTYHWVFSNYHNINWWQNELGANSTLANLGLFTFDYLGKKGQDAFNGKIRESSLKYRPSVSTHTGANVFDYIDITCRNAAINNDKEEMDIAFDRLKQEIRNDGIEGFQKDGSFFQHGRQVQNVSYGKSIIRIGKTLYNLRGTDYKMPDDKMTILSDYILKGIRDSTFKGYTNYTTVSREYSRVDNLDTQKNGFTDLAYFTSIDNYSKKNETIDFVKSLGERKNAVKSDEITYFPVAKMIVANIGHAEGKDGIYISYKATEPNLTNTECVNGENQLGLNLSYGTNTCVMDHGDEYLNISPVMNYDYMPGTTSVTYGSDDQIKHYASDIYGDSLYEHKVPADDGTNKYIYNDGQQGTVTFSMTRTKHHDRSEYTVTCIATTDGVVLIGSDFKYTNIDAESLSTNMHTTLDQYITKDNEETGTSKTTIRNHSDGNVKYTTLDDKTITKKIETRSYTGTSWKRNNRDLETTDSGTKNVATITLDGDTSTYAYAIEPYNVGASKFKLAYNENSIHAIELPDGRIAAAFYDPNNLSFQYPVTTGPTYSIEPSEFITSKGAFKIFVKQ